MCACVCVCVISFDDEYTFIHFILDLVRLYYAFMLIKSYHFIMYAMDKICNKLLIEFSFETKTHCHFMDPELDTLILGNDIRQKQYLIIVSKRYAKQLWTDDGVGVRINIFDELRELAECEDVYIYNDIVYNRHERSMGYCMWDT